MNDLSDHAPSLVALGRPTHQTACSRLWQGDAGELLRRLPDETVDLVLTSPPYGIGKAYDDVRSPDEYVAWCAGWIRELVRVLAPHGTLWLNVGYMPTERGCCVPISYLLWPLLTELQLVQEVIWAQPNGVAARRRLSPRHETLLWLVKDADRYAFDLDAIRDPDVKYPDQTRRGRRRTNPLGKNPGSVWAINRVVAGRASPQRTAHPAQMPLALATRVVLASSRPGDVVLDPFAGSGTTLVAAADAGRVALGFEREQAYLRIAADRLGAAGPPP